MCCKGPAGRPTIGDALATQRPEFSGAGHAPTPDPEMMPPLGDPCKLVSAGSQCAACESRSRPSTHPSSEFRDANRYFARRQFQEPPHPVCGQYPRVEGGWQLNSLLQSPSRVENIPEAVR